MTPRPTSMPDPFVLARSSQGICAVVEQSTSVQPEPNPPQRASGAVVMVAAAAVGLAYAALTLRRSREPDDDHRRRSAVADYLCDHLAGSDAAVHAVAKLREGHRGTPEAGLFARLHGELQDERRVLLHVLSRQGASSVSLKRLAGQVGGAVTRSVIEPSWDLTLLRTLEALCVGIQGKRCLWRALHRLQPALDLSDARFGALEAQALRQWEEVDAYRQSVALKAFSI